MSPSPSAHALIAAGLALLRDDGAGFIAAFRKHDWKTVAIDVVQAELALASAAGVPGAGVALKLLPLGVYMLAHPATVESAAMKRAAGADGGDPYDTSSHPGQGATL